MSDSAIFISKNEIKDILGELVKHMVLVAPAYNGKKLDYIEIADIDDMVFGDELPYKSAKEFFFPRCEKIITFKDGNVFPEISAEQTILFGAKPCDLEALEILRKIFTEGKFKDPFFEERYKNTLTVGVGCENKKPGCFCDERETDMGYSNKCDLFLRPCGDRDKGDCGYGGSEGGSDGGVGGRDRDKGDCGDDSESDNYEVLYVSEKGREAFGRFIDGLEKFENPDRKFEPEKTLFIDISEEEFFDIIDWEKALEICQGCGACTYICPTCHCFTFKDVDEGGSACRYRNWDSCMFPKFSQHASGHNPRTAKHERYRQRMAHKYLYVKENFGQTACTGCGRCIRSCPTGVNIRTIAERIMEELK